MLDLSDSEDQKSSDGWIGDPDMLLAQHPRRGRFTGFHSFNLTRRIFLANFIALSVLLVGALLVGQPQNQFSKITKEYLSSQADFQQKVIQKGLRGADGDTNFALLSNTEKSLLRHGGLTVEIYTDQMDLVNRSSADTFQFDPVNAPQEETPASLWENLPRIFGAASLVSQKQELESFNQILMKKALENKGSPQQTVLRSGDTVYAVARMLTVDEKLVGFLVIQTPRKLISDLSSVRGKAVFAFFFLALAVALMFAAVLARAITNPLNDLARAAEIGTAADLTPADAHKALIPNLAGRTDVIGRLSSAMADMTSALYERIATNESFAADVAHEIKNPLASMRSAVETLRVAKEGKGKAELLDILEMDVRRLDRLVSDISNASRLDAELVNEETQRFELTKMLSNIVEFHRMESDDIGIDLYWEGPAKPIHFDGLEERLAQVFVNLVTNAISFCKNGDAIRVWCRVRGNRVLAVVEDTGPGIPDGSLKEIFRRFYSQRPSDDFGNHSGLGLAISKQIVEAHGGTIWAENIRTTDDLDAPVLGARFIVGFPI
jgi:two-component system sensor histidine kinase ChvG